MKDKILGPVHRKILTHIIQYRYRKISDGELTWEEYNQMRENFYKGINGIDNAEDLHKYLIRHKNECRLYLLATDYVVHECLDTEKKPACGFVNRCVKFIQRYF